MRKLLLALAFCIAPSLAWAQNVQCPDRPLGDSTNACANTRFVQQNAGGGGGSVPYTNITNVPANSFLGNNTGSPANAIGLTATQSTAMLNNFTSSLKGLVPGSGGGTANFLRADGTWVQPATTSTGALYAVDYGVTCDGSTNDTIAMQAAATASANNHMILPAGTCILLGVTWPSNTWVQGQGGQGSCNTNIKRPGFASGTLMAMGTHNSSISDLCIDGNWPGNNLTQNTNGATGIGLQTLSFASVSANIVPGMWVRDLTHISAIIEGTTVVSKTATTIFLSQPVQAPGVSSADLMQFSIPPSASLVTGGDSTGRDRVDRVAFTGGNWIDLMNVDHAAVIDCYFEGTGVAYAGGDWGIYSNVSSNDLEVANTTVYGYRLNGIATDGFFRLTGSRILFNATEAGGGQVVSGGSFQITGNAITGGGAGATGIEVVGQGAITGNHIQGNPGAGVYLGTTVFAPDSPTTITGNTFQANTTGVTIQANSNGTIISSNHFYTSSTAAIQIAAGTSDYNSVVSNICQANTLGLVNGATGTHNYIPAGGNPGC